MREKQELDTAPCCHPPGKGHNYRMPGRALHPPGLVSRVFSLASFFTFTCLGRSPVTQREQFRLCPLLWGSALGDTQPCPCPPSLPPSCTLRAIPVPCPAGILGSIVLLIPGLPLASQLTAVLSKGQVSLSPCTSPLSQFPAQEWFFLSWKLQDSNSCSPHPAPAPSCTWPEAQSSCGCWAVPGMQQIPGNHCQGSS